MLHREDEYLFTKHRKNKTKYLATCDILTMGLLLTCNIQCSYYFFILCSSQELKGSVNTFINPSQGWTIFYVHLENQSHFSQRCPGQELSTSNDHDHSTGLYKKLTSFPYLKIFSTLRLILLIKKFLLLSNFIKKITLSADPCK